MSHCKYAPSSLRRLSLCPGSLKLSDGVEEEESHIQKLGTKDHEMIAKLITDGGASNDDRIDFCYGFARVVMAQFPGEGDLLTEHKLDLSNISPGMYGTADLIAVSGKEGILIDWKFGFRQPPVAAFNPQIIAYAVGVFDEFALSELTAFIAGPHIPMTFVRYTKKDVEHLRIYIQRIISYVEGNPDRFSPSFEACLYCPGKMKCRAHAEHAAKFDAEANRIIDFGATITNEIYTADMLDRMSMMEDIISRYRDGVKKYLAEGGTLPGWKIKNTGSLSFWIDDTAAEAALEKIQQETGVKLFDRKPVTPPRARKLLKDCKIDIEPLIGSNEKAKSLARE